jgi:hypothetical protein
VQLGHAAAFRYLDAECGLEALLQGDRHRLARGEAEVQAAEVICARLSRFGEFMVDFRKAEELRRPVGMDSRKRLPRLETREDDARSPLGVKRQHLRAECNQITDRQHD